MDDKNCLCNDHNCIRYPSDARSFLETIGGTPTFWCGRTMTGLSWYYMQNDIPSGPVSWTRLGELAQSGMIRPGDLVRHEESPDWIFFANAAPVQQTVGQPLAPPVEEVVNVPLDFSGWSSTEISPWRRYGARMLDTATSGFIGSLAIVFAWFSLAPISAERFFSIFSGSAGSLVDGLTTTIIAGFVNGILIGATGSSIGKAIFGVKVLSLQNEPIGIIAGWVREAKVWVIGLGLGIPIISLLTLLMSARRLVKKGEASWDHGRHVVYYRHASSNQTLLNILGVAVILGAFALFGWFGQQ